MSPRVIARATTRRVVGKAGGAVIDQLLSSGTSLLLMLLVARAGDAATFGALSVALIVNGFLLGVGRAAIGEVVLLRCRAEPGSVRRHAQLGLFLALIAGVAAGSSLLVTAAVVGGEVGSFLWLVAVAAPFVHTQDLLRHVAYGSGRVGHAIGVDATWLGVQAAASIVLLAAGGATPTRLGLAWVGGAAASSVAGALLRHLSPRRAGMRDWWRAERSRALAYVLDFLVSTGVVQASFVLLSVLLPLDEFGGLRAAFVSLSPLANLLAGVRTLTLAHLAGLRSTPGRARRRAAQLAAAFGGAGLAYGAVLVVVPDRLGSEVFGATWSEAAGLVGIVAVGEALRLSTFAAIDLVKVVGSPTALALTRGPATAGVVLGLLAGAAVAGPRGAATCMAAGYAGAVVIWWRRAFELSGASPGSPRTGRARTPGRYARRP